MTQKRVTRRGALQVGALGALSMYAAACGSSSSSGSSGSSGAANGGDINWLTWSDHWSPQQIKAVKAQTKIAATPTLFSDDSEGYLKIKQTGGQFGMASIDALWAPKFHGDGLTQGFDIDEIKVSKELYPLARNFPFFQSGGQSIGYPFAWSTIQIYYNPTNVTTKPDSWHALLDPAYKSKIVAENQPTDLVAMAGRATGAKDPYNQTTDELSKSKDFLTSLKPNILKLVSQNTESVAALVDGSAWIAIENLGTEYRVKDANGPTIMAAYPSEGTYGFIDCEQIVKAGSAASLFVPFINAMETGPWIAKNFITNGRPLFNEAAYKILVNQGQKERADNLLYNQPEKALDMTLKGPSGNTQAVTDTFNEVFGA